MQNSFKAAVLEKINEPLVVASIVPTELKIGQVLVKILVSGLCGAQLQEIAGLKGNANFTPHLIGHEGCGIVLEVGQGVTRVKPGDRVIMHWRKTDGIESAFPSYIYNGKNISSGKVTTLSELSIVSENRLTVVDSGIPKEFCALLGCGMSTALGIVNYDANIKFGESVLVLGCGGVGLNIILAANLASAGTIYGVDISTEKKKLIEMSGGICLPDKSELKEKIDVIIDTTGNMDVVSDYLDKLSSRGRCIIVSQPNKCNCIKINNSTNFFAGNGQIIRSTQGGNVSPADDFPRYIKLLEKNKINFEYLITNRYYLEDINKAIHTLKSGTAGRIMVYPS